jgi:hypothetical protein
MELKEIINYSKSINCLYLIDLAIKVKFSPLQALEALRVVRG